MIVVIELPAEDVAKPVAADLVAACSQAHPDGECVLGGSKDEGLHAFVVWEGAEHQRAFLWVEAPGPNGRAAGRRLEFADSDKPEQRWRSVGFVIGSLAMDLEAPREAPAIAKEKPARVDPVFSVAPTREPSSAPAVEEKSEVAFGGFGFQAGGLTGWEPTVGNARAGAQLEVLHGLGTEILLVQAGFRYAAGLGAASETGLSWYSGSAGIGVRGAIDSHVAVEATVDLVIERLDMAAFDSDAPRGETGRTLAGGRIGIDLTAGGPLVAFVGGLEASAVGGTTQIEVGGRPVTTVSPFVLGLTAGVRVIIPDD
ncbi:MAG: hypothetical protein HOV80_09830 [Polyangiaceae bacterium]|nr:hypothetical protein [Polyangiaceae bacterium]